MNYFIDFLISLSFSAIYCIYAQIGRHGMTIWQGIVPGMTAGGKVVNNQEPATSVETTSGDNEYFESTSTVRTAKPHELYTAAIGK